MHITTVTVQVLSSLKQLKCKRPITHIWASNTMVAMMVLFGSIRAVAEQSISSYHLTNPVIVARLEASKAGIDPKLVEAILWHESRNCSMPTTDKTDLGCMQISRPTAAALGLDSQRLIQDKAYNIKAGVAILAQFKRYKAKDRLWWTRYNTGFQKLPKTKAKYAEKVGYNEK